MLPDAASKLKGNRLGSPSFSWHLSNASSKWGSADSFVWHTPLCPLLFQHICPRSSIFLLIFHSCAGLSAGQSSTYRAHGSCPLLSPSVTKILNADPQRKMQKKRKSSFSVAWWCFVLIQWTPRYLLACFHLLLRKHIYSNRRKTKPILCIKHFVLCSEMKMRRLRGVCVPLDESPFLHTLHTAATNFPGFCPLSQCHRL